MATSSFSISSPVIKYHRRNDRTPEKKFEALTELDKKRISEIRTGIEHARKKVDNLSDTVGDRERSIESEQSLRVAAEEKLQKYLVDMYGCTEVNEELHQRLPQASKSDPMIKVKRKKFLQREDKNMLNNERQKSESDRPPSPLVLENIEREVVTGTEQSNPTCARRVLNFKPGPEKEGINNDVPSPLHSRPPYAPYYPMMAMPQAIFYNPVTGSPYSHPMPIQPSSQFRSTMQSPITPPVSDSGQSYENQQAEYSTAQLSRHPAIELSAGNNQSATRLEHAGPMMNNFTSMSTPYRFSACSQTHLPHNNFISLSHADGSKQLSLLLVELDNAKSQNKKLSDKLNNSEQEVELLRVSLKTKRAELISQSSEVKQAANIVQDVYDAQRKRDEAVMGRIQVANEERDEMMMRLGDMSSKLNGSDPGRSDTDLDDEDDRGHKMQFQNIDQLLSHLGVIDAAELGDDYTFLPHHLEAIKQRQKDIAAEEMHVLMEQRDMALAKCHKIEEELIRSQREAASESAELTLKAKLTAIEQERNLAVNKVRFLEDEIEKIRIYYSLHKSLSQETILRDTVNNTLDNYESKLKEYDGEVEMTQKENNRLMAQLRTVVAEKNQLAEELNKAVNASDNTKAQNEKLQRLVHVLRKKLNNLGGQQQKSES